jgi:hypothetical protein
MGLLRWTMDVHQIEVDLRRQPLVEAEFLLAEMPPPLQAAEVDESKADRLFQLVGTGAAEKHPGDVGLEQGERAGGVGIGRGLQEGSDHRIHPALPSPGNRSST